jgi:hypothetical protein
LRNELQNTIKPVLDSRGWTGPFWLTETGWKTADVGNQGQADRFNSVLNTWMTGTAPYDWIDKIFFFLLNEGVGGDNTYGILDYNAGYNPPYTRKPAYNAYQNFILNHQNYAQFISSTIPSTMRIGQTVGVQVTFKNTGYASWTAAGNYRLGGVGDSDPFAPARQDLAPGDVIAPGQSKTFTFNMTAPTTPGTYLTDWQMLVEGLAWFGDVCSRNVDVVSSLVYSDTFTSSSATLNGRIIEAGGVAWAGANLQATAGKAKPTGGTNRVLANIPINSAGAASISVKADMRDNVSGWMFLGLPGASLGNMDQTNRSLFLEVARNGDHNIRSVTGGVITTHYAGGTIPGWVINSTHAFELIYHVAAKTVDIKMDGSPLVTGVSVGSLSPLLQYAGFQGKRYSATQVFNVNDIDFDNFVTTVQY